MSKDSKEVTQQVAFRLAKSLIHRLDRHAARMNRDLPGLSFNRVDAVKSLLTAGLDEVEAGEKRGRR